MSPIPPFQVVKRSTITVVALPVFVPPSPACKKLCQNKKHTCNANHDQSEECPKCQVDVLLKYDCNKHEAFVPCHYVGLPNFDVCPEMIQEKTMCGHGTSVPCDKSKLLPLTRCEHKCNQELVCGHTCKGTCSKCHCGRHHVKCEECGN